MHTNNLFEKEYLKLIQEQTDAVLPKSTCKKCGKTFLNVDVDAECPECKDKTVAYDALTDGDYPVADADADAETDDDVANECNGLNCEADDDPDSLLKEDDFKIDSECDGLNCECGNKDPELAEQQTIEPEDGQPLNQEDDLPLNQEDGQPLNQEDDLPLNQEDENPDDQAAKEDEEADADAEKGEATAEINDSKIVSFTSADPAILEVFEKVQAGQLKLVAVPVDFEFAKEDNNENPDLTADVLENFEIEPVAADTDEDTEVEGDEAEDADEAEEVPAADQEEAEPEVNPQDKELAKESCTVCKPKVNVNQSIAKVNRPGKGSKYGPY